MFPTVPLSIIRNFFTVHTETIYVLKFIFGIKLTCFGQFLCPSSGVFHCTHSNDIVPQIYFWNKSLHVSDSSSVHHQELFTVHTAVVYFLKFIFGIKFYLFRRVPLSIIRNFFTVQTIYLFKFIFGIKLYMFRTVPLSTIRSFSLYTKQWYIFSNLFFGIKLYMFRTVPLPIIRGSSLHRQQRYIFSNLFLE